MGVIQAPYAPVLPFRRPTEDPDGNVDWAALADYPAAVEFTGQGVDTGTGRRRAEAGLVYVPRGSDVKIGDQFQWTNGNQYTLTGGPRGDQDHIFTGADFGWVECDFVGAVTRWS